MDVKELMELLKNDPEAYKEAKKLIESEASFEKLQKDLVQAVEDLKKKNDNITEVTKLNGELTAKIQALESEKAELQKKETESKKKDLIEENLKASGIDSDKIPAVLKESWMFLDEAKLVEVVKAYGESLKSTSAGLMNLPPVKTTPDPTKQTKKLFEMSNEEFINAIK